MFKSLFSHDALTHEQRVALMEANFALQSRAQRMMKITNDRAAFLMPKVDRFGRLSPYAIKPNTDEL